MESLNKSTGRGWVPLLCRCWIYVLVSVVVVAWTLFVANVFSVDPWWLVVAGVLAILAFGCVCVVGVLTVAAYEIGFGRSL